jgi:hypothetical protein
MEISQEKLEEKLGFEFKAIISKIPIPPYIKAGAVAEKGKTVDDSKVEHDADKLQTYELRVRTYSNYFRRHITILTCLNRVVTLDWRPGHGFRPSQIGLLGGLSRHPMSSPLSNCFRLTFRRKSRRLPPRKRDLLSHSPESMLFNSFADTWHPIHTL